MSSSEGSLTSSFDPVPHERVRIVATVCTYRRNEPLERLLIALRRNLDHLPPWVDLGVVVVDDNPDGQALPVCEAHLDDFPLGLHYRRSGQGNISIARNIGLETALPICDWVALTDDDCEPLPTWLQSFLDAQRATGATALTGPCYFALAPGSPRWLSEQPFLHDAQLRAEHHEQLDIGATNNSFINAQFLIDRPWLRFEPELGILGGEDVVFFRRARREGLDIRFCPSAEVTGYEPPERCTLRYQIRTRFWLGNTEYVTHLYLGEGSRSRWILRSGRRLVSAIAWPCVRLLHGEAPQFRYGAAMVARAIGNASGALGFRVRHH